ncbi:ninja-family protein AFP3-like [Impatiens glandulifera]|uniref:ninja-family protein AFP3-like n=1 Tax=Impatiens glandulifera TaxID=253017 RepID=UPI001FB14469|nr:ninja-family protein AFP3-like [Impatiens glandulifera]
MARSDEVMSSIGSEIIDLDSYFPTSESSEVIDLGLSLGGFYGGGNVTKEILKQKQPVCDNDLIGNMKCFSLGLSSFSSRPPPVSKKMFPECPKNWSVKSGSGAAFARAMEKLKSKCSPLTIPLIEDPMPIVDGKDGETSLENPFEKSIVMKSAIPTPALRTIMPCVTAIGDGPYGRRIKGFLFSYNDDKIIDIVCICHGKIMSPSDFIKHAGGIERRNPMKYIKVTEKEF